MTKDNSRNRRYRKEEKEKLIARMLPPESISPSKLSVETGISKSTLATWKTKATVSKIKGTNTYNKTISSREKFLIVMEMYSIHCKVTKKPLKSQPSKYGKNVN